jgi:glycolate oxidase
VDRLRRALPDGAVATDPDLLIAYAGDESHATAVPPALAVRATRSQEVSAVLAWATEHGVAVTPRGGGSGKAGGCVPEPEGLVLSLEGMNRLETIDRASFYAVAGAGIVTEALRDAAEAEGLFYAPDPASLGMSTLGGNVATNAGGPRAFRYGATGASVLGLDVVFADGQQAFVGKHTVKGVAGLDLCSLLVGSEGTLAVITGVKVRLRAKPRAVRTLLGFFADDATALAAVHASLSSPFEPSVLEFLSADTLDLAAKKLPFKRPAGCRALLLSEVEGDPKATASRAEDLGMALMEAGALDVQMAAEGAGRRRIWELRRDISYTVKEDARRFLSEDIAVPLRQTLPMLDRVKEIAGRHGLRHACYGHAGDGNLHVNLLCEEDGQWERATAASEEVFRAAIELGGTITGEHGVGRLKRPYLAWEQANPVLRAQRAIKGALDPAGILNPNVLLP